MKTDDEQQQIVGSNGGLTMLRKPTPSRPMPPRIPIDSFGGSRGIGSNMSLTNFLAENDPDDSASYTSLLAGAMNADEKADAANGRNMSTSSSFGERLQARNLMAAASRSFPSTTTGGGTIRPSTARFKSMPPSRIPIPKAPCVTIPPGLSPTTLLDSPVLLSHQAEPSPTTGTFPLPPLLGDHADTKDNKERIPEQQHNGSSFVFKPFAKPGTRLSPLSGMPPFSFPQHIPERPQFLPQFSSPPASNSQTTQVVPAPNVPKPSRPPAEKEKEQQLVVAEKTPSPVNNPPERASDDGFNWRKYGQKLVKGSDNPRSYYKCTYVNCLMKKKVERSPDGQVTEIVYEGEHNHPKPQPTRRSAMNAASKALVMRNGNNMDQKGDSDASLRSQANGATGEPSSSSTSDDDGNEDEPDGKRRKKEKLFKESPPIPRTIREPRVVVQTTSEVDVLDDGYRWRKYGQKVVKGNPHPRSYYKCTNLGCPVRKHVERACDDPRAVITTYEGKHNHDVPAARGAPNPALVDRINSNAMEVALPTQSGGSDVSAVSFPTPVTSPEPLSRIPGEMKQQLEDGRDDFAKVKGEVMKTGTDATRPKAEPEHTNL